MTIAIAIKANDGIVIAADGQEGSGYPGGLKTDQSKVRVYESQSPGAIQGVCAITGAGTAGYIDALSDQLGEVFFEHAENEDAAELTPRLAEPVRRFYAEHVVPFGTYPAQERPDVEMLIALQSRKITDGEIFLTTHGALHRVRRYAAVGAGAPYAKAILNKYRVLDQSDKVAVLAAYVIWAVKETIEGCGKYSTVTTIHGPAIRAASSWARELIFLDEWHSDMPSDELDRLEHYFLRKYAKAERDLLWRFINGWAQRRAAAQRRREEKQTNPTGPRSPRSSKRDPRGQPPSRE